MRLIIFGGMNKKLLNLIYLAAFFFMHHCNAYDYKLSIVAITKDEHEYICEWVDYHCLMGVDHFYIYDNNTDDKTATALKPYVKKGIVEIIPWPNLWPNIRFYNGCQVYAYNHVLKKAALQTEWLAIIDT